MESERVYLFKHIGTEFVKIGMTKNSDVLERFKQFSTYAPQGAEIVGVIATNNALQLEKNLHNIYKDKRLNGEFFRLTDRECLEIIKKYNDQKRNKAISLFFEIITNETFDIDLIISELKNQTKRKEIGFTEYHNLVKGFLEENKNDCWLTASEIKELIELKYEVKIDSMKIFGSELRKSIGLPKSKRIKGVVLSRYFIQKSLL